MKKYNEQVVPNRDTQCLLEMKADLIHHWDWTVYDANFDITSEQIVELTRISESF